METGDSSLIKDILDKLGRKHWDNFRFELQQPANLGNLPLIPYCKLEEANRIETTKLITQTYHNNAIQVVANVLEKIKRNDLLIPLRVRLVQAAVKQVQEAVAAQDEASLLDSLRLKALGLRGVQDDNAHRYLDQLRTCCQLTDKTVVLDREEIQRVVSSCNDAARAETQMLAAVKQVQEAVTAKDEASLLDSLRLEALGPLRVQDDNAHSYLDQLSDKTVVLDRGEIQRVVMSCNDAARSQMLAAVKQVQEAVDAQDEASLLGSLRLEALGLLEVQDDNAHSYLDQLTNKTVVLDKEEIQRVVNSCNAAAETQSVKNSRDAEMNPLVNPADQTSDYLITNDVEIRIVLVGKTGAGKSATGNTILGSEAFIAKVSSISVTETCSQASGVVAGRNVSVIDTPGLIDTKFSEDETIKEVTNCISYAAPGPQVFLAVIALGRFTDEEKKVVAKIQEKFGQSSDKYTMILFTHGDKLKGQTIEERVKDSPEIQELISKYSGFYHVFNNESKDPSQVTELLVKINQMVKKNGGSHYTNQMFQEAARKQDLINDKEIRIVLVGKTGAGKSATGNTILGPEAFESRGAFNSVTKTCSQASRVVDGRKVSVIDTPGLFDTKFSNNETIQEVTNCIRFAAPGPHVFLAVISVGRYTEEERNVVAKIQKEFGECSDKYTMILFTHGDELKDKTIEEFVKDSSDLLELIRKYSGFYHVFNNEDKDPSQVNELLEKIYQMVEKNGGSHYTNQMFQEAARKQEMAARGRETIGDESLEDWTELGSGGFTCVYKASHKDWGFDVAIKLLHVGSDTFSTALGREAGYMDSAAFMPKVYGMYRGIPPVPKLGCIERHGIVMELMQRGSLLSLQKALSGPPPRALAFRLANQVAVAMNFLHSKKPPVVHSDLKPDNVLLDAKIEFGLSMVSTGVLNTSNKGDEGGTLFYTAPEACEQHYRLVRSYDVYSYGILLWTILTGKEPYPAGVNRDVQLFRIMMQGDRPDLHTIDQSKADGIEELVDLMERCWDKDPTKRPTFRGCTEVTGRVFSKHQKGIKAAVYETLTKLDLVNRQEECVRPPGGEEMK